jgi:hypothetical protein
MGITSIMEGNYSLRKDLFTLLSAGMVIVIMWCLCKIITVYDNRLMM